MVLIEIVTNFIKLLLLFFFAKDHLYYKIIIIIIIIIIRPITLLQLVDIFSHM